MGMSKELDREVEGIGPDVDSFELRSLLRGPDDHRDAQVKISAGAGGTEAQDSAQNADADVHALGRRRGFVVEILDMSDGEETGIKGAILEIKGHYAFGFLRPEAGVHRLVRISPFDAQSRRHTSFASVFVYPVVNDEINIELREEDIEMDVFRASGAGGQHMNKTSSAVRLTHIPSGLVSRRQQERSQFKNKQVAMKILKNRLYQLEADKQRGGQGVARLDESGRDLRQPDPELRVPAVHNGQRPPNGAQDPGRPSGDGRRLSTRSSRRI